MFQSRQVVRLNSVLAPVHTAVVTKLWWWWWRWWWWWLGLTGAHSDTRHRFNRVLPLSPSQRLSIITRRSCKLCFSSSWFVVVWIDWQLWRCCCCCCCCCWRRRRQGTVEILLLVWLHMHHMIQFVNYSTVVRQSTAIHCWETYHLAAEYVGLQIDQQETTHSYFWQLEHCSNRFDFITFGTKVVTKYSLTVTATGLYCQT